MSDPEVKRLTPNSIANRVMADDAWHDSLYVKAEDYDSLLADFKALRTALAAPEPEPEKRHPGYIIGNHWLETAYERLCAGEAEDAILEDYELVREPRLRDLRRDAERWRHWGGSHGFATIDHEGGRCFVTLVCDAPDPDQAIAKRFAEQDFDEWLGAFTDAAMDASTAPTAAAVDAPKAPEAKP